MPTHATLDGSGKVPLAQLPPLGGGAGTWGSITGTLADQLDLTAALAGKQAAGSYAAASHSHIIGDTTGLQTALDGKQAAGSYAAAAHSHVIADVTGLQTALDGKQAAGSYAAASHTHTIADTTGLQAALDGKQASGSYAAAVHSHAISDVTGLQTALDGKAATGHDHTGVYQPLATVLTNTTASFTTAQETKLAGIAAGATVNDTDANLKARANHTGTQLASTISDFSTAADARIAAASVNALSDVTVTAPSAGQVLKWNGSAWVNDTDATGGGGSAINDLSDVVITSPTVGQVIKWDGANWVNFDDSVGTLPIVSTLAADQATGANTTPVTLTSLLFAYAANSTYQIWAMGNVDPTAATTGCGFQFDLSTTVTSIALQFFHQLASTGTLSGGHSIADDASVGVSSGMPGTVEYPVTLFGVLRTNANAGTAQLRFRSETTAVTTCKAGFTLMALKIA